MWKPAFLLILSLGAVARAQTSPQALVQDAIAKQNAGDLEGAVKEYREFLRTHPNEAVVRSNMGAALAGLGRFEEAITEYRIALKQSPALPGAALNLALAYYKMGRIGEAASRLVKVHQKEPQNEQATLLLADCYLRMGQNEDAIALLQPEEKLRPDDLAIVYMLGTALIRNHQVRQGEALVDRILRNGESAEAHLMLGSAKMDVADFAGARDEFDKAVALNPNLPEVHGLYAQSLRVTGDPDGAAREFKAEFAVAPYDYNSNLQVGSMLRQNQHYDEARPYLLRALKTRPGDAPTRYQLATIALSEGKVEEARRELELIVKELPQFTEAHVSLSIAYFRLKRPDDANRERDIVAKLTAESQAKQPGAKAQ